MQVDENVERYRETAFQRVFEISPVSVATASKYAIVHYINNSVSCYFWFSVYFSVAQQSTRPRASKRIWRLDRENSWHVASQNENT